MKFTVVGPDGKSKMVTWDEVCIPCREQLEDMAKAGYKFYLNKDAVKPEDVSKYYLDKTPKGELYSVSRASRSDKVEKVASSSKPKSRSVKCVETGEVFPTQSAAAKHFGIDPAVVSDSIKLGKKRSGYTFERV